MENLPITKDNGRKRTGDTRLVGAMKLMNWQRKNSGLKPVGGGKFKKTGTFRRVVKRDEDGEITSISYRESRKRIGKGGTLFATGKLRKFLNRRASGAKFTRIGWLASVDKFTKNTASSREGFSSRTTNLIGDAKLAVPGPVVEALTINRAGQFDVRFKPARTSGVNTPGRVTSGAIKLGTPALIKAIEFVRKDMIAYIVPRLQRIASRINTRR